MKLMQWGRTLTATGVLMLGAASAGLAADYTLKYGHPGPVGPDSEVYLIGTRERQNQPAVR